MNDKNGHSGRSEKVGERVRVFRRGTTWCANYQMNGKQFRESLKTANKKTAIRKAMALDHRLAAGERPAQQKPCGIGEAVEAYQEFLTAERRARKTISKYSYIFSLLLALAEKMGRCLVSQIDLTFADRYRAQRARTCAPKTVYGELVIIRQLVKFAVTRKLVPTDPLLGLKLKKPKPTPQPCFDDDQIARILELAQPAHYPTFLLLSETGLRIGEAQWMTWDDVDFKKNVVHVRAKDGWKPKSGDSRAVPMSPKLQAFLRQHPKTGRWVLTAAPTKKYPTTGRQISERRSLNALKRVLKKLTFQGKLHTFRHSFISRCLTLGIEESVVRSWVGHVDPEIMRLYTHISSPISQDRIQRLRPAGSENGQAGSGDSP